MGLPAERSVRADHRPRGGWRGVDGSALRSAHRRHRRGKFLRTVKKSGFTLFEILIALAMFSLALGGLAIALDRIVEANALLRSEAGMRQQLESLLDQAMALPIETLAEGRETGPDAMGVKYSVSAEQAEIRDKNDAVLPGLWWITVRAEWTDGNEKQEREEKFLRYQP
ncbi:MAG: type II secretion system protein [Chthoniobacterales bacterium]|nr:type II secretion system protein [Chthoniobacterales bacterium]